ncbi:MAG TPA: DUF3306 domain-containing protein [Xanthobacteraceae bacterium]|nr:DUF3306 domain-containing protein [Xanthobacteraceae bacterium]
MSEPEDFLTRWSRRKAAATEERAEPKNQDADEKTAATDQDRPAAIAPPETAPPAFDPATLPPIESIVAGSDITMFLRAGVPAELMRAALRRAWAADPAIRDFIGLSENSWDFTAPGGMPGFGPLSADDASRLMAHFTGQAKQVIAQIKEFEASSPPPREFAPNSVGQGEPEQTPPRTQRTVQADDSPAGSPAIADAKSSVQREKENAAMQKHDGDMDERSRPTPRLHGGALPK